MFFILEYLLLSAQVSSIFVFESVWRNIDCNGSPSVMYLFHVLNPHSSNPQPNQETWPPAFNNFKEVMPIGYCPKYYFLSIQSNQCCITWLDKKIFAELGPYESATYDVAEPVIFNSIPVSARGEKYCILESKSYGQLFGYQRMYIREGECIEGVSCEKNKIVIHPYRIGYQGCVSGNQGDSEEYILKSANYTEFKSKVAGEFRATYVKLQHANLELKWKGYLPDNLLCI